MMGDNVALEAFEPLNNTAPTEVLDQHPNGHLVALRVNYSPLDRAAVWDRTSGKLFWIRENTVALCWLRQGNQVALVRGMYQPEPDRPDLIASALQSEHTYLLERQTWPDHAVISVCDITIPEGWVNRVIVSPRNDIAVVRWFEQDAAGFVLVGLREQGDVQRPDAGYRTAPDNVVQGPVFSPDGHFIVLSCGRGLWWSDGNEDEDPAVPARGGRYEIGHVAIYNALNRTVQEILIEENIPAGWRPDNPDNPLRYELLSEPQFITDTKFIIRLPTGTKRQFSTV